MKNVCKLNQLFLELPLVLGGTKLKTNSLPLFV
jgi:hypothetical protein